MGNTLGLWLDRARAHLGDLGHQQRIDLHDLELGLQAALGELGRDRPREVSETFAGDGTAFEFVLAAATFVPEFSKVLEVEHPTGERRPVLVDSQAYMVLRGTGTIRLLDATPSTGSSVKVTYTSTWPYPTDSAAVDLTPAPWFDALAALAASEAARHKAAELAKRSSKQVAGVEIRDPATDDMFRLSAELRNVYRRVVLGSDTGSGEGPSYGPALVLSDADVSADSLFHSGRR